MEELRALPIVGDVRGAGFFRAVELVKDDDGDRFDQAERDRLLRGYLPKRLLEAGLIARADDRGDSVLQIAPPLICDADVLDEIVDRLGTVLSDAGDHMSAARRNVSSPWPRAAPTQEQIAAFADAAPRPFWLDDLPPRDPHPRLEGTRRSGPVHRRRRVHRPVGGAARQARRPAARRRAAGGRPLRRVGQRAQRRLSRRVADARPGQRPQPLRR